MKAFYFFLSFLLYSCPVIGLRDRLLDAVHMADLARVKELLDEKESGVLTAELPISVLSADKEYERTPILNCGLDPQNEGINYVDITCTEIAKLLHKAGADLRHADKHGWNAVAFASVKGFSRMTNYLIEIGVPFNNPDDDGRTPLMKATAHGFKQVVQVLVNNGADTSLADKNGWTVLHFIVRQAAAEKQFVPLCAFLVSKLKGSSVMNAREESGRTALMFAVAEGSLEVVDMLLLNGADSRLFDFRGNSALDLAKNLDINRRIMEWNIKLTLADHERWLEESQNEFVELEAEDFSKVSEF